jgi:hypothetical protein
VANRWQSTTLVDANFEKDDINKVALDLLNKINITYSQPYPIGALYEQFATQPAPAGLYPGTVWSNITSQLPQSAVTAVYASGTNYIQWTDGTMKQWGVLPGGTSSAGGPWTTSPFNYSASITFPQTFADTTYSIVGTPGSCSSYPFMGYLSSKLVGSVAWYVFCNANTTIAAGTYEAIGKWSLTPVYPSTYWVRTK